MRRQGQLDEDAVDRLVAVEIVDEAKQLGLGGVGGQAMLEARHAGGERRLVLGADIDLARRILADQQRGEAGLAAGVRDEGRHRGGDPGPETLGERLAVDQNGGHAQPDR